MNFGIITTQDCQNVVAPTDPRCSDPEFARENPDLCPAQPTLVIKPALAISCALGSMQFRAFSVQQGVETDVTTQCTFTSSDPNTAVIGVSSGNATGLAQGDVTIAATYQGMTAHAEFQILNCSDQGAGCRTIHVALMVLMDISKSMSLGFDGTYRTRLDYAKAAASRFIGEIDGTKDSIGLMTFTDAAQNLLSAPTGDVDSVVALVNPIAQTQDKTSFFQAVTQGTAALNATSADRKVLLIISDGEDTAQTDSAQNDPFQVLADFKNAGGIVMCLGVRASTVDNGFYTLSQFSSGGFMVNAYPGTDQAALDYISGLKGYVCAGNCTPAGDFIQNEGELNYTNFLNWTVVGGHVDLIGNGFLDLLPGNGLYVDLGGSTPPYNGTLQSRTPFNLTAGHTYRVTLWLAGNQQADPNDLICKLRVLAGTNPFLSQDITITDNSQGFTPYAFNFTAPSAASVVITIQQALASGVSSVPDPRWGLLLNEVAFEDTTDVITLLDDNFDSENPVYIPPGCGTGTTYVYLSALGHYGYETGYNCYGGYGCLNSPPGVQLPDPSPLSDIESGESPPPQQFTSTQTQCVPCPDGSISVSNQLVPTMTGPTSPSGVASSDSDDGTHFAWQAVGGIGWLSAPLTLTGILEYQFATAQTVAAYIITALTNSVQGDNEADAPRDWTFEGSNDGSSWTVLDTQTFQIFRSGDRRPFSFTNATAYLYYRINITANDGDTNGVGIAKLEMYASAADSCATATATSQNSQADADSNANKAALKQAQDQLNCATVYTSTQQYTASCGNGCGASVTKSATASSFLSQHAAGEDAAESAKIAAQAAADCAKCNNNYTMTIADAPNGGLGLANLYPSCKCVTGMTGTITKVTVVLHTLFHQWPSDLHFIVRHPDGTAVYVMGNCGDAVAVGTYIGGGQYASWLLELADDAASPLPTAPGDGLVAGTFQPTVNGTQVIFTPPAPQGPGLPTTLATFIGKDPNGTWTLWAVDARPLNTGGLAGGWDLLIETA